MADFKKKYLQLVEYLKNGGVEMYKDFLCFCGRGNLLSFAVFNQMQIFYANSSATVLYGYDEWIKQNRMPVKGKGIMVMSKNKKTNFIFDYIDTFSMNGKNKNQYDQYDFPEEFRSYDIRKKFISDIVQEIFFESNTFNLIKKQFDFKKEDILSFFVDCCGIEISSMQGKQWKCESGYDEMCQKLLEYNDCVFVWFQPYINKTVREIKNRIFKENVYAEKNELSTLDRKDDFMGTGDISPAISNVRDEWNNGNIITGSINESSIFTEEYYSGFEEVGERERYVTPISDGENNRGKSIIPGLDHIEKNNDYYKPHRVQVKVEREIYYGASIVEAEKELSDDFYELGYFVSYYEASEALLYYRSLSNDLRDELGYRITPDNDNIQKRKDVKNKFEGDFKQFYYNKQKMSVIHPLYKNLYQYAEERKLYFSYAQAATIGLIKIIDGISDTIRPCLYDILNSNLSLNEKKDFLLNSGIFQLINLSIGYNACNVIVQQDVLHMHFNPFLTTGNSSTHTLIKIDISVDRFLDLMEEMIRSSAYSVIQDYSPIKGIKNGSEEKFFRFYDHYVKDKNIGYIKAGRYPQNFSNISIENTSEDIWNPADQLSWNQKYELIHKYNVGTDYDELLETLKNIYKMKDSKFFVFQKGENRDVLCGMQHTKNDEHFLWYRNEAFYRTSIPYTELEHRINKQIENKSLLYQHDKDSFMDYIKKGIEQTRQLIDIGLNPECIQLLEDIYMHNGHISSDQAADITFMRILVDQDHARDRIYLKEVFSQTNLSYDDYKSYLHDWMKNYLFSFFGTCDGRILGADEKGIKIFNSDNILYPVSSTGEMLIPKTYEEVFVIPYERAIKLIKGTVSQKKFRVDEWKEVSGCSRVLPNGFCKFYNEFKENHSFEKMFDTSKDVDDPWQEKKNSPEMGYKQLDLFQFSMQNNSSKKKLKRR